jgi:transcriptional regulator with XRE-family HTH domain
MSDLDDDRYIGQQILKYRQFRGMTQQHLGDLLGRSRVAISQYETGQRPVADRQLLYGLAEALQVSVGHLTGHEEDTMNPATAAFHAAVPRIEAALMCAGQVTDTVAPRPVDQLVAEADAALALRAATDYASLGRLLPGLLTDLYRHTLTGDETTQRLAWSALAKATFCTSLATKGLGHTSLAWISATAATQAANKSQVAADQAAAAYMRAQVMLATPSAVAGSLTHTLQALDAVEPNLRTSADRELYGMLQLHAALTSAALGEDPQGYIDEALSLVGHTDATNAYQMAFGGPNIAVWRMSIDLERREAGAVIQHSHDVDPNSIATADRQSRYFIELARGLALAGDYRSAMSALLRAEVIAPQQVRSRSSVRELVGHMLRTARRELAQGDLGRMARRVGAVPT